MIDGDVKALGERLLSDMVVLFQALHDRDELDPYIELLSRCNGHAVVLGDAIEGGNLEQAHGLASPRALASPPADDRRGGRRVMEAVTLYTSSTCPECERAARALDALGIPYVKRAIDLDPEAQTDALMLRITRVPVVVIGGRVLRVAVDQLADAFASQANEC